MMHIRVQGQTLFVEFLHFTARLEGGLLVSLVDRWQVGSWQGQSSVAGSVLVFKY
jgi:hypothetical protein